MAEIIQLRKKIELPEWQTGENGVGQPVTYLDMGDFGVSYIVNAVNPFDQILVSKKNRGRPETALVLDNQELLVKENRRQTKFGSLYFILYGDWRKAYEQVATQGFAACYGIFAANLGLKTETSSEPLAITP